MSDIVNKTVRSRMMSGIRSRDTQPELIVRRHLHAAGLRFRLHDRLLPGRPDIVLPRYRTIVFVHGCFWHQHQGCRFAVMPKQNREFWEGKLSGNTTRDREHESKLTGMGWRVMTVWECEMSSERLSRLVDQIRL
jgi:DNA mismatch endonuclease, patch repair protein